MTDDIQRTQRVRIVLDRVAQQSKILGLTSAALIVNKVEITQAAREEIRAKIRFAPQQVVDSLWQHAIDCCMKAILDEAQRLEKEEQPCSPTPSATTKAIG